jgi:hypothetical protein
VAEFNIFIDTVKEYAKAYIEFERIQKDKDFYFVPEIGDQKTGVIGEAFIFEYLKRHRHSGLEFGHASQTIWDIKYRNKSGIVVPVQVKTVSAFSKTKGISPIHLSNEHIEIYIVSLNKEFIPEDVFFADGFCQNKIKDGIVKGLKMPKNEKDVSSGFEKIKNIFEDFRKVFPELYTK